LYKTLKNSGFIIFNILNLCLFLIIAPLAFAAETTVPPATKAPTIPTISTLPGPQNVDATQINQYLKDQFLPNLAMTIIKFAIPLSVVFLIFGAIQFISGLGNTEKITLAKKTVTFALIGLVVSLLSYAIVQLVFYSGYTLTTIK
jgi:hypothetical protein